MKRIITFAFALLLCASFTPAMAQWAGSGTTSGDIWRDGNVGIGLSTNPITNLDVRGRSIFLAPTGTSGLVSQFTAIGESFGQCLLYGFRAQYDDENFINVGVKAPSGPIAFGDQYLFGPTISWGNTGIGPIKCVPGGNCFGPRDRPLFFEFDGNPDGCGTRVAAMFSPGSTYQFRVYGQAFASGSWVSSDRRFKNNVEDIDNAMDMINKMEGVSYGYNTEEFPEYNFKDGLTYGFIAQDLGEVAPEMVATDAEGYYAVNYDAVIPVLVEALKEKDAQLDELRTEIAEIKAMLAGNNNSASKLGKAGTSSFNLEGAELFQNQPNPFNETTRINYFLPNNVQSATLIITDINGEIKMELPVNERGNGEIAIQASELSAGIYFYSMLADGQRIATRKMVLNR